MIPPEKNPAIDTAFDVDFADRLARFETYNKHNYRPNTYLHKWWGRRCGSTFRLILKGLVEDPEERSYYAPGGLEGKIILDPMMGGGTTLHEAIRLGASVIGVDVDPIPVLQGRATLTEVPLPELKAAFDDFQAQLVESIGTLYETHCPTCDEPTPLWHTLYGLRRNCSCSEVLVVDSFVIRHETKGSGLSWCAQCAALRDDTGHICARNGERLVEKRQLACDFCGERFRDLDEVPHYQRYRVLGIAGHCEKHGLFHKSPDWRDLNAMERADELREGLRLPVELFCVGQGDKSVQLLNRNIRCYLDLFSSRQLIFLNEVIRLLPHFDSPVRLNLALLVSTSLEFNSMLCGYKGASTKRAGAVRHTFSHHGYSFPYTALENNPLYPRKASGTLQKLFHSRIVRGREWSKQPVERVLYDRKHKFFPIEGERDFGEEVATAAALLDNDRRFLLRQGSSVNLPVGGGSIDAIVTDPPYYDTIQYGDLSAFFRVWLRQFLPDAAQWDYDQSTAAVGSVRSGTRDRYIQLMTSIFRESRRVLRPETGRLIFTFHHWQARAWSALSIALHNAGFRLLNRYVVHAEHPMSVHISKMRALTHDAILVLTSDDVDRGSDWEHPLSIPKEDGFRFTEGCGTLLGWILDQRTLTDRQIDAIWKSALSSAASADPVKRIPG